MESETDFGTLRVPPSSCFQSTGFMVGNSSTSRVELESVKSITMRSMP